MSNTILLKGRGIRKEGVALLALSPGELVELNTSSQVIAAAVAKENITAAFVVENELLGSEITVDYAALDNVVYEVMPKGAEVLARLAASAAAIVVGDLLESAGDGTLRKQTPFSQSGTTPFAVVAEGHAIARAIEAVDNSGGGAEVFIQVEVL